MGIETTDGLEFVKSGRLNIVCLRNGKEVERLPSDGAQFLNDERVVRSSSMDVITFQPNVIFKLTLDFRKLKPCVFGSVRENTDWVLMSTTGATAVFNRVDERLILQQCKVDVRSTVKELEAPVHVSLAFNDDEWVADRVFR